MAVVGVKSHNVSSGHSQLTRSLERILEEAHFSGELRLSNRKLKDFPKSATKYNLSDTVIADLSRNRFCEVPEDLTTFAFLETLILYHNTIRTIPPSIKGLSSLTYLDLRSNQLSVLPREICFLPLQVLLIANNRLISLPDELGRMERLTDLDASCNQLTNLPTRIGDLRNLRSLSLRNNQLVYLPREITYLLLVELNLSCNRISSLPHEVRHMTTLVVLNLENNPLTSPPASLCVRGLVHVFKYLDTQAMKDEKQKSGGGNYDGYTTLRRAARHTNSLMDNCKSRRQHIDSGYSTSDGLDKRWSQDLPNSSSKNDVVIQKTLSLDSKTTITPETNGVVSTIPVHNYKNNNKNMTLSSSTDVLDQNGSNEQFQRKFEKQSPNAISNSNNSDNSTSPEEDFLLENQKSEDKSRNLNIGNIQTYREYKEALKQQRNQEIAAVYRAKEQQSSPDSADNCSMNVNSNGNGYVNGQARATEIPVKKIGTPSSTPSPTKTPATTPPTEQQQIVLNGRTSNNIDAISPVTKKPVQKVIPSRVNTPVQYQTCNQTIVNGSDVKLNQSEVEYSSYVKPCSPIKAANGTTCLGKTVSAVPIKPIPATKISSLKSQTSKTPNNRNVSWNHDIPAEKLSFTMRREFDKQKEETELLTQLRTIIESRLKMTLPSDISSALMDGVILCHLANFVRPRSVASIHVPSPGVPKLTMARCRRNVDNFLEACRKIGVDEELICSCEDVINSEESSDEASQKPNQSAVLRTIGELLKIQRRQQQQQRDQLTLATNANRTDQLEIGEKQELTINGNLFNCVNNNNNNNNNNNHKNNNGLSSNNEILNSINISANKSKQYDDGNYCNYEVDMDRDSVDIYVEDNEVYSQQKSKNNFHSNILRKEIHFKLNNIQEEDNENEDIGVGNNNKLNCKIDVYDGIVDNHDTTKSTEKFNNKSEIVSVNDLNSPTYKRYEFPLLTTNVNIDTPQKKNSHKIVNKRIEFYENNCYLISNDKILVESNEKTSLKSEESKIDENYDDVESNGQETFSHDSMAFSIVLSCTFILTFLILILLPLPN